jgi:hypothetical protein
MALHETIVAPRAYRLVPSLEKLAVISVGGGVGTPSFSRFSSLDARARRKSRCTTKATIATPSATASMATTNTELESLLSELASTDSPAALALGDDPVDPEDAAAVGVEEELDVTPLVASLLLELALLLVLG